MGDFSLKIMYTISVKICPYGQLYYIENKIRFHTAKEEHDHEILFNQEKDARPAAHAVHGTVCAAGACAGIHRHQDGRSCAGASGHQ